MAPNVYEITARSSLVETWCSENGFKVNTNKTKSMLVACRAKLNRLNLDHTFCLNGLNVQYVKHFTYLGIILDTEMSLKPLFRDVKKKNQ